MLFDPGIGRSLSRTGWPNLVRERTDRLKGVLPACEWERGFHCALCGRAIGYCPIAGRSANPCGSRQLPGPPAYFESWRHAKPRSRNISEAEHNRFERNSPSALTKNDPLVLG